MSFLFLFLNLAFAVPSQVILIRHAEKPDYKSDSLSEKGFARANELVHIFTNKPVLMQDGLPVALFASSFIPGQSSQRCIQTLTPLSKKLALPIQSDIATDDYNLLAQKILTSPEYNGRSVMVAWTHSNIVGLAQALGSSPADKWSGQVFDRIWLLTYQKDGTVSSVDIPQNLLPGDSN